MQGNIRLPYQYLSTSKDTVEVESIISEGVPLDSTSLGDDNERTGVQVEVTGERVIDVQFGKLVSGVMVDFKDITRYYTDSWYILKDGSYVLVDKNQLHTFTFSELQIRLEPRTSWGEVPVEVVYI
ncbi:MAG: hypothetical protein H6767_09115 [Candidatus Peribacteria bacterium]|nr:MAG: hypothetical protein H6767_09115 [Candidatus Peribacteria bacterium]